VKSGVVYDKFLQLTEYEDSRLESYRDRVNPLWNLYGL